MRDARICWKKWTSSVLDKTGARVVFSLRVTSALSSETYGRSRGDREGQKSRTRVMQLVGRYLCYAWACLDVWRTAGTDMGGGGYSCMGGWIVHMYMYVHVAGVIRQTVYCSGDADGRWQMADGRRQIVVARYLRAGRRAT